MKRVRNDEFACPPYKYFGRRGVRSIYLSSSENRNTNFKVRIEQKRRRMVEPNDPLIEKIKQLIIQRLKLVDMTPEMIENDAPLFGEGLGLDSIDALELVLGLEKEFGVMIPDAEVGKKVFQSVRTVAQYVLENQGTA
jgi:acyl carrier protein